MIPVLLFAVLAAIALGAIALSFVVLMRARMLIAAAEKKSDESRRENEVALDAMRERLEGLCGQLNDLRREPAGAGIVRPGLNLSKRSQALRMHRRGDSPEQIASALDIPLQELDLLVKVHRIVMSSF
jgi:Flp pilus assembly protein TadB